MAKGVYLCTIRRKQRIYQIGASIVINLNNKRCSCLELLPREWTCTTHTHNVLPRWRVIRRNELPRVLGMWPDVWATRVSAEGVSVSTMLVTDGWCSCVKIQSPGSRCVEPSFYWGGVWGEIHSLWLFSLGLGTWSLVGIWDGTIPSRD